jgi:site-specific DNA-methyltransferase (adenine-specific)
MGRRRKVLDRATFTLRGRNPDVLSCIANLSNDEVFTPPELANRMLDTVAEAWAAKYEGANLWEDKTVKFLDPCTKTGIFLREITRRLTDGLAKEIPDLQKRVDHILTKQVFGIGITKLTSLLARRSVYCSKRANGTHSVAKSFTHEAGNIWFERMDHTWGDTKCIFCGAPQAILDREQELENYAYAFIHTHNIQARLTEIFEEHMQFDVIIGNPPYQMKGGAGGSSDSSIYHLFIEQAKKLDPKFLSMVVPSRWLAGGRGLDEFRKEMLGSNQLCNLVDFQDAGEAFPGVQIKGGICYFLWNSSHRGLCNVTRITNGNAVVQNNRTLGEFDIFVRDERALGILRKVLEKNEVSILDLISGDTPFGIATNFTDWTPDPEADPVNNIPLHLIERGKRQIGFMKRILIRKNAALLDSWKVLVPKAYGAGETFPHQILGKEIIAEPPASCTQTYLVIAPFKNNIEAESFSSYYRTRFFRFLVSLRKITQDALKSTYTWVPQQKWDHNWTDEELYAKYNISADEINYIESMIRPMEQSNASNDDE